MKLAKGYTKVGGRYRAQVFIKGKTKHLGFHDTPEEATAAYNDYRAHTPVGKAGIKKSNNLPTGVTYSANKTMFIAAIKIDDKNWHLGTFPTVDQAEKQRKKFDIIKKQYIENKAA